MDELCLKALRWEDYLIHKQEALPAEYECCRERLQRCKPFSRSVEAGGERRVFQAVFFSLFESPYLIGDQLNIICP